MPIISSASIREYTARKLCTPQPTLTTAERVAEDLEETLLPAIEAYLDGLGSSTWGRNFSIDSPEGRERCGTYILNVMRGVSKTLADTVRANA